MEETSLNVPDDILSQELPDVNINMVDENNIEQENEKITDNNGNIFDPEKHATDKDGNPSLTKTGKFRNKTKKSVVNNSKAQKEATSNNLDAETAAFAATHLTTQCGVMIAGEDALPTDNEKQSLIYAYKNYFESKGVTDFPPNIALAVALIAYGGRVITTKKGLTKIEIITYWIKSKLNRKKKNGTRVNSRDNGKREDNPRD